MRDYMILAMVRHGQTNFNAQGIIQGRMNNPLNDIGRKQAEQLAEALLEKHEHFDFIASSPLSRALETAYLLSLKLNINKQILVDHQFTERDFYHLDGKHVEDVKHLIRQKNYEYDGYENDKLLIERVTQACYKLSQRYPEGRILFVAHSHVIKALLVHVNPDFYNFATVINNAEVLYFDVSEKSIRLIK
ncbi:MAG TPA: phosphoglycerate mutase [Acholeplasmataceae bacterium]|nr:phosphoglycerate mutase [Acholeplasmataceae bacterium]